MRRILMFLTAIALFILIFWKPEPTNDRIPDPNWTKLSGSEIEAALDDKRLIYANAWQDFMSSGRTLYNAGRDSWGTWRIQGDQYCSQWPPNAGWDCYFFERHDDGRFRFVDHAGATTEGRYAEE